MMDWYFLLTPFALLAVLLLFGFVGCNPIFGIEETELIDFYGAVQGDAPVIYLRLQESSGATAKNENGPPDGTYVESPSPIDAGDPNWKSTEVQAPLLNLGVTDQPILLATDPSSTSIRVRGAWINFPSDWPVGVVNPLPELTLEAIVLPEWNLMDLGKYYCILTMAQGSTLGFGLYAGPDSDAADSPYTWQFWVGTPSRFQRIETKKPYQDPNDQGPTLAPLSTYLAVTLSQSQQKGFLYMWYTGRDMEQSTYELDLSVPYVPFEGRLTIGISDARVGPLFPPFPLSTHVLYPFWGRFAHVAIYDKVLTPDQLLIHGKSAFTDL